MQTHVKVLGALYLAVSAVFLLMACSSYRHGWRRGDRRSGGRSGGCRDRDSGPRHRRHRSGVFLGAFALPGLAAGYGLLKFKPWARIVGIVLSALKLINVPLGTILGAYGLWVLLSKDTERLFDGAPVVTSTNL